MGQSIQDWAKQIWWTTTFKKFQGILFAQAVYYLSVFVQAPKEQIISFRH